MGSDDGSIGHRARVIPRARFAVLTYLRAACWQAAPNVGIGLRQGWMVALLNAIAAPLAAGVSLLLAVENLHHGPGPLHCLPPRQHRQAGPQRPRLEAQREAVATFLNGGNWSLIGEFTEVESGKNDDRPQLTKALETCRLKGATLVIAKLDRLSRDAHFLLGLEKAGVDFVAADMPNANRLTVRLMAVIAQEEREMIAARTKAALAAAKARGVTFGGWRGGPVVDGGLGAEANRRKAMAFAADVGPMVAEMRDRGMSLRAIAAELAAHGIRTPRGGQWSADTVRSVLLRVPQAATTGTGHDHPSRPSSPAEAFRHVPGRVHQPAARRRPSGSRSLWKWHPAFAPTITQGGRKEPTSASAEPFGPACGVIGRADWYARQRHGVANGSHLDFCGGSPRHFKDKIDG